MVRRRLDPLADRRIRSFLERAAEQPPAVVFRLGWTGIGVARGLVARGVPVVAVEARPRDPSTYTRICPTILSENDDDAWRVLLELGDRLEGTRPVLFLTVDHDVVAAPVRLGENGGKFSILLPEPENVRVLMDKLAFAELAASEDLPTPTTFVVRDDTSWQGVIRDARFPIIVKPKYRTPMWLESGLPKVFRVETRVELEGLLTMIRSVESDYVVQEWIPGPDSAMFVDLGYYRSPSEPLATFTLNKLRQWPPGIGSACAAEQVVEPEVEALARRVLRVGGLRGFGAVEVKRDARDGRLFVIEPAVGRPVLGGELARVNGVDLVFLAYCHLSGATPPVDAPADGPPTRWFYLEGDLRTFLARRAAGDLTLREWLSVYRGRRYFVDLSWRDPLPFAVAIGRRVLARLRRPLVRRLLRR